MLRNNWNSRLFQYKEYNKFIAKSIACSILVSAGALIAVAAGIVKVRVSPLLLNVIWIYPIVAASLLLSKKAIWFTIVFQLLALIACDYVNAEFLSQNSELSTSWFVSTLWKGIQFITVSLPFVAINGKLHDMAEEMCKSEEEKNDAFEKLKDETVEASELFDLVNGSVNQVMDTANRSKELNKKLTVDVEHIRTDFEYTLMDMDNALKAACGIREKQLKITEKGNAIADIFAQEDTMNDSVKVIIDNVVKQMQSIENSTEEGMEIIEQIHKKSVKVLEVLSFIEGTVEKIGTLSLNAYIEASRTGSFQNGFEVVAYDIKKLGERAEKESQMILSLTKDTVSDIEFASKSIKEDIEVIKAGQDIIEKVEELFAKASFENKKVNEHIKNINDSIKSSAGSNTNIEALIEPVKELNTESVKELEGIFGLACAQDELIDGFIDVLKNMEKMGEELKNIIGSI